MNPARSRHCHRGADPSTVTALHGREDRGARRSGSQDTPAAATDDPGRGPRGGRRGRTTARAAAVLLLSTSDTDLLAARASGAGYRLANPARLPLDDLPALLDGADVVVVRLLGGEQAWREGLAALRAAGRGRWSCSAASRRPDAALMALSTVPAGIAAQAHEYLAHGGTGQPARAARTSCPTRCC